MENGIHRHGLNLRYRLETRMKVIAILASTMLCASLLLAQDRSPSDSAPERQDSAHSLFPKGYLDHLALTSALRRQAETKPEFVRVSSLAKSGGGRDVWLVALGKADAKPRPAILLVANLEADHVVGSQVALGLIERLAEAAGEDGELGKLLERRTIYIVPRLNPDGAERVLKDGQELRTNLHPIDRDRDGRQNEDGPEDLNGDGVTTRMRAKDEKATLIADEKDARILRRADAAKGEKALYSDYSEGIDNDKDGRINEDPPGGVNLNRNWPHRWTEFDLETGFSPASEPEVRALIQFAFDHPEIAVVWSFGLNDNLKAEPKKPATTIDDVDLPLFAELSRLFNKSASPAKSDSGKGKDSSAKSDTNVPSTPVQDEPKTEPPGRPTPEQVKSTPTEEKKATDPPRKGAGGGRGGPRGGPAGGGAGSPSARSNPSDASPGIDGTTDGALSEWAYHQYGAVGLASRLWPAPEISDPAKDKPQPPAEGEARWLYWNDHVMDGRAFVPLSAFQHPTLGEVQVGGWRPGVRLNPPTEQVEAITKTHLAFLKELLARLPALDVPEVKVESKGGGLFQVTAVVHNSGYLPTALAQGVRTREADPVLVRLKTGEARILTGRAHNRIDTLAGSGGRKEFRWLISAPDAVGSITLEASSPKAGLATRTIELK